MTLKIDKEWNFGEAQEFTNNGKVYNVNAALKLSEGLDVKELVIADMDIFYTAPCGSTLRSFIAHMKMVNDADLSVPILRNEDGVIIDGRHRLCKAILEGKETIKAVRFIADPVACYTVEE